MSNDERPVKYFHIRMVSNLEENHEVEDTFGSVIKYLQIDANPITPKVFDTIQKKNILFVWQPILPVL